MELIIANLEKCLSKKEIDSKGIIELGGALEIMINASKKSLSLIERKILLCLIKRCTNKGVINESYNKDYYNNIGKVLNNVDIGEYDNSDIIYLFLILKKSLEMVNSDRAYKSVSNINLMVTI